MIMGYSLFAECLGGGYDCPALESLLLFTCSRGQCNLCSSCTSLFGLFILTACLLVCAGLTWMHIEMKKDIESLRRGLEAGTNNVVNKNMRFRL